MKNHLDWSSYEDAGLGDAYADIPGQGGDFAKAVAVCINSGVCEQPRKGVMCPSFRVTGNSHLSPGGRVRLLKQALNAELTQQALNDDTLHQAMQLCLGCKGCKRECENNIDMAMIKTEYLAHRHHSVGIPLRTRLLAQVPRWLQRWSALSGLIAYRNRSHWLKNLMQRWLGISALRQLPQPVKTASTSWFTEANPTTSVNGEVVLLIDTFSRYFSPQTITAAIDVLQQAGYAVITTDMAAQSKSAQSKALCCGRSYLAHGLIDQATEQAESMLKVLHPHALAGRKIIGLEPACLLAIRDDYRFLGLGAIADTVADKAVLFEEFIAREYSAKRFKLTFKAAATIQQPLQVHGHCHQKAVGAMKAMRKVLKLIDGLNFELIESSCCGMAGSFGLEQEHAELSLQMAEQDLFPALREQPAASIVANGFSCQQQIQDGLQRESLHIAEVLQHCLVKDSLD